MIKTLLSELIPLTTAEQKDAAIKYINENHLGDDAVFGEIKALLEKHDPDKLPKFG